MDTPDPHALAFHPVPGRQRHDGWTPDRQRRFVAALTLTGTVARAAQAVEMSGASAYNLRRRPQAESFAGAWHAAPLRSPRDRRRVDAARTAAKVDGCRATRETPSTFPATGSGAPPHRVGTGSAPE